MARASFTPAGIAGEKGSNRRRKAALSLVRANDAIYHEDLQVRNMVQHHHLAKSIQAAGWRVPHHPELQGSVCRLLTHCCAACLHRLEVFWLQRDGNQRLICPLACMPGVWNEPAARP
jgi:hypothetical protein